MIADWSTLNMLTTPRGNLALNASSGQRFLTLNENCSGGADLRFTFQPMPQHDGQLNNPQYLTGYGMQLALALWVGEGSEAEPACGGEAQEMLDLLGLHLDAIRNPTGTSRIVWTPEGMASRMVNDLNLAQRPVARTVPRDAEAIVTVTFAVVSEFPYELSEAEQTPDEILEGTTPTVIDNEGTTQGWPVFKVYGPTGYFELANETTGKVLVYNSSNPGGQFLGTSEYVEIDMFRGTVVLNGDVDDSFIAGITFTESEFWALQPGENDVTLIGADSADILWGHTWL